MSYTLNLPTIHTRGNLPRRRALLAAALVAAAGTVLLAGAPLTSTAPARADTGVRPSILACKLRVIREANPPATDVFADIAVTREVAGWHVAGSVTATTSDGASVTLPWTCATERRGADWYPWSVQVGH